MDIASCAITGHRPNYFKFGYDEEHPDCIKLKLAILRQIELFYHSGFTRFLTGGALGVDMWAAEIVIELMGLHKDMEFYCVIPYEEQAARWSPPQRERYYTILSRSTRNILIGAQYTGYCYSKRNRYLVDNSDILMAVYDAAETKKSGTRSTVEYAHKKERGILFIHPDTARITQIVIKS